MYKVIPLFFLFTILLPFAVEAQHPNVVVFLSDDQGWGDLSSSGNTDLMTPNIDSLAEDGASFDRFFVNPVCSPTRAEFLTGRHHAHSGVYSTSAGGERMDLDETTIADLFRSAGYATAAFGKWHNGMQHPYHPNGRGFDEFYGFCSGHWGDYYSPMLERNGRIVDGEGFCIDDFTNHAMAFMEDSVANDTPFFAYVPYNTPHSPMQVPNEYWMRFSERTLQLKNEQKPEPSVDTHKRCALAMCENLDWNVGRVLEKLDSLGAADDTIVVWFHDNGPNGVRWNGGMKGRKGSTDEGGVRSPLYIRWPGMIEPGTDIPQIASVRDLLPTLCDLANVPFDTDVMTPMRPVEDARPLMSARPATFSAAIGLPAAVESRLAAASASKRPLDGVTLKPLLLGEEVNWSDRVLINHWGTKISARTQQFRLDNTGKLFDMVEDPGQRTDATADFPEVAEELAARVTAHRERFMPTYYQDDRPFVIAHPDSPFTQIPARDGTAHGNIRRSNKFPNCSYFLNWTSTEDKITWPALVGAGGTYEVTIYYAAKEVGAKCELRFQESVLPFQITDAHDVPQRGGENDRHPRMESYVKDFKAMGIGRIHLEEGAGELTLLATEIPGAEAMEFRMLTLERIE